MKHMVNKPNKPSNSKAKLPSSQVQDQTPENSVLETYIKRKPGKSSIDFSLGARAHFCKDSTWN